MNNDAKTENNKDKTHNPKKNSEPENILEKTVKNEHGKPQDVGDKPNPAAAAPEPISASSPRITLAGSIASSPPPASGSAPEPKPAAVTEPEQASVSKFAPAPPPEPELKQAAAPEIKVNASPKTVQGSAKKTSPSAPAATDKESADEYSPKSAAPDKEKEKPACLKKTAKKPDQDMSAASNDMPNKAEIPAPSKAEAPAIKSMPASTVTKKTLKKTPNISKVKNDKKRMFTPTPPIRKKLEKTIAAVKPARVRKIDPEASFALKYQFKLRAQLKRANQKRLEKVEENKEKIMAFACAYNRIDNKDVRAITGLSANQSRYYLNYFKKQRKLVQFGKNGPKVFYKPTN